MSMSEQSLATVRAVSEKLGDLGAGFYFTPETLQRGKDLGMPNGFAWYVYGRGSVLGDVDAEVIQSAFAYFEPKLLRKLWNQGAAVMSAEKAAAEYAECCRAWGRHTFAIADDAAQFANLAERVIAHADSAGQALFAGWKAQPLGAEEDPAGRAGMACNVLRELRGSINIMAIMAVGLTPQQAHFTAGGAPRWKLFGYAEDAAPATESELHAQAEVITDMINARAYEALSDEESVWFVAAVEGLYSTLG